jgi:hypothetical protein
MILPVPAEGVFSTFAASVFTDGEFPKPVIFFSVILIIIGPCTKHNKGLVAGKGL